VPLLQESGNIFNSSTKENIQMAKAGKELYVGSLSYDVTEYELEKLFAVSGKVTSIHLITDAVTGEFKGCGYVRMSTEAEARDAIDSLDGALLLGKKITVSYATPQKMKPSGGGLKGRFIPRREKAATGGKAPGAKPAAAKPATAKPATAKPATAKPATAKPATAKPATAKPAAPKAAPGKPAEAKAASARPAAAKPRSPKPAGSKPAPAKTGFSKPGAAKSGTRTGKR
jgi:RNA recognition motif-containing protein